MGQRNRRCAGSADQRDRLIILCTPTLLKGWMGGDSTPEFAVKAGEAADQWILGIRAPADRPSRPWVKSTQMIPSPTCPD